MQDEELEDIEIALVLEAIHKRYGHDFRDYARASIKRRLRSLLSEKDRRSISGLIPLLLHDEGFLKTLLCALSITVSEMFRDPGFFLSLRQQVIPYLRTFPFVKIWHAGCATGEEVYSLAILLKEEGLYDRCTIYATDFNEIALDRAREGIYPLELMKTFTSNYQQAGGPGSFSQYYHAAYDHVIFDEKLRKNILFAHHNLSTDSVFSEIHLVLCRNVLIYFNRTLQDRVLRLFHDSLVRGGLMALGSKESLQFTSVAADYKTLDPKWKIYQRIT
jgi:chemotaxis protein methyltransferase CheR